MRQPMNVAFLGRELGTASGWGGALGEYWRVYDFKPNGDVPLLECKCLQFDEGKGQIIEQDDEGNALRTWNLQWTFGEVILHNAEDL